VRMTDNFLYDMMNEHRPVHAAFGLSYASYFCVPRIVLEAMPVEWQRQFVALMTKLPQLPTYDVQLRDEKGRFVKDPLADYRHGKLPKDVASYIEAIDRDEPHPLRPTWTIAG
jgi:hypothetical protein